MTTASLSRLGDEIELAYGKSLPADTRRPGSVPVFGSNGQVGTHDAAAVEGPGIVVGRKGSVGEIAYASGPFWPIDTTYFVINRKGHHWRFLYHLLRHCDLTGLNSHSAVPGLNREDVYNLDAWVPDKPTQVRVAAALDQLERLQNLEHRAESVTMELKRLATHELLTRGLRGEPQKETEIGLMPEGWSVVRLGSLGRIGNGSTPKKSVRDYWDGGTFPWLTSAKVYDRDIVAADAHVTPTALKECHLPVLKPGAVLIAITGQGKTLGHCAVLRMEATINQHLAYLQPDLQATNPRFVAGYLETQYDYLRQVASGGGSTKGALTCAFLRDLPLPMPPTKDEQDEIAEVIDAIDRKIDLHRRKRAVLEELFSSLLHKLMAGELQVSDLDLSALTELEEARS